MVELRLIKTTLGDISVQHSLQCGASISFLLEVRVVLDGFLGGPCDSRARFIVANHKHSIALLGVFCLRVCVWSSSEIFFET